MKNLYFSHFCAKQLFSANPTILKKEKKCCHEKLKKTPSKVGKKGYPVRNTQINSFPYYSDLPKLPKQKNSCSKMYIELGHQIGKIPSPPVGWRSWRKNGTPESKIKSHLFTPEFSLFLLSNVKMKLWHAFFFSKRGPFFPGNVIAYLWCWLCKTYDISAIMSDARSFWYRVVPCFSTFYQILFLLAKVGWI